MTEDIDDGGLRLLVCADILSCKLPLLFHEVTRIFAQQTWGLYLKHDGHILLFSRR